MVVKRGSSSRTDNALHVCALDNSLRIEAAHVMYLKGQWETSPVPATDGSSSHRIGTDVEGVDRAVSQPAPPGADGGGSFSGACGTFTETAF